jgi:integrase
VQIAQLRRQDVHHDHIVLTNRKGGRERILRQFLTTHAAEAISAQLAEHTSEYVWPGKRRPSLSYNTALKAIQTACRRAEIPEHSYHRVRYWAGATMVGQGFSNRVVGRFLGHSTTAVTERYMYVEDAELRRVAERLSSALGAVDLDGATAGATRADVDGVQRG